MWCDVFFCKFTYYQKKSIYDLFFSGYSVLFFEFVINFVCRYINKKKVYYTLLVILEDNRIFMKESFGELYARLYRENFNELEALRQKAKKESTIAIIGVIGTFLLAAINPLFIILFIISILILALKANKGNREIKTEKRQPTYAELFKEKIVGPIIENSFEASKYEPKKGISRFEYVKAGYRDRIDRYHSDDLIIAPLKSNEDNTTFITFAEVHTEVESRDKDGHVSYSTQFQGLAGSFLIPKDVGKRIYIRSNGGVGIWNKNRVKMDMPEFEKMFDVESDDAILTMRILTADVMAEMIDLYNKYKYRFEIHIINDTVYMRLRTGAMFEPSIFKSSLEYKQIEKYYLVLKALTNIATHIYDTILKLDI